MAIWIFTLFFLCTAFFVFNSYRKSRNIRLMYIREAPSEWKWEPVRNRLFPTQDWFKGRFEHFQAALALIPLKQHSFSSAITPFFMVHIVMEIPSLSPLDIVARSEAPHNSDTETLGLLQGKNIDLLPEKIRQVMRETVVAKENILKDFSLCLRDRLTVDNHLLLKSLLPEAKVILIADYISDGNHTNFFPDTMRDIGRLAAVIEENL